MGTRKNAKFLSSTEIENFVTACVLMKADIVNPGAPGSSQYSKWDEYVAIHLMIQNGIAPGGINVNFGHGGNGAYSFLSWHRYFLYQFEQDLQSYVPGVMLPYWDWTDPGDIMTDTFMGPNGNAGNNNTIEQGYFAFDRPATGANATALPAWYPAGLNGWRMPSMFPSNFVGGLKRQTGLIGGLPSVDDISDALAMAAYPAFQNAVESGGGIVSGNQMHNGMHNWLGGGSNAANTGHMTSPLVSPFDPFFYLHHCNIDRLWAMWQTDGHANEYPLMGGDAQHHRNDIMYPWTGGAAGYGTSAPIAASIPMPDFGGLGAKLNVDTLDFRTAFGYTYDTIPIIGIGLDRTGSMNGLTPDPMVVDMPDVTKWEAAVRGVSAFLQDCETVQDSGAIYVTAGIKTFRSLGGNVFTSVFGAPNYGLIKTGTAFSKATFDGVAAGMTAAGGTPLADALLDVQNTLVEPPAGGIPADERRYLAMLTDGMLTTGAPMNSIPDGSMDRTAIFAMGFGTGLDVDYATLASMVAKGVTLDTQQVFHGEEAGTIDKFFTDSLATAIGFDEVFDPVVELFEGEHTHLSFMATSADDAFLLTAQGMDFTDKNWSFVLHAPNGQMLYNDQQGHQHSNHCNHCCEAPHITTKRSNGRLSMIIQRGNTGKDCWVGTWTLMVSYKAKLLDKMMMPELGELLFPVGAGPIKGDRYLRLLYKVNQRKATRNVFSGSLHGLDHRAVGTNSNNLPACNLVMNVYARTSLKLNPVLNGLLIKQGEELKLTINSNALVGAVGKLRGFARLVSPGFDVHDFISKEKAYEIIVKSEKSRKYSPQFDFALMLAKFERENKDIKFINDLEVKVVTHDGSPLHIHHKDTSVKGTAHIGLIVEGLYFPDMQSKKGQGHGHSMGMPHDPTTGDYEIFSRIFNVTVGIV